MPAGNGREAPAELQRSLQGLFSGTASCGSSQHGFPEFSLPSHGCPAVQASSLCACKLGGEWQHLISFPFLPQSHVLNFWKLFFRLFWFDFLVLWGGMVSLIPLFYFCVVLLEKSFMLMVFFLFLIFVKLLLMVLHVLAGFDVAIRGIRWPEIKPFFMVIFFPKHLISLLVHVAYLCTYISRGIMSCIKLYLICLDHV